MRAAFRGWGALLFYAGLVLTLTILKALGVL
jgi:hypothetical protein